MTKIDEQKIPFTFYCPLKRWINPVVIHTIAPPPPHTLFVHVVVVGGGVYKIQGGKRSINYEKKLNVLFKFRFTFDVKYEKKEN